jgi:hypothetical protein
MITELQYKDVALAHISSPDVRYDYSRTAQLADNTDSAKCRVAAGIVHVTLSESLFNAAHSFTSLLSCVPTAGTSDKCHFWKLLDSGKGAYLKILAICLYPTARR